MKIARFHPKVKAILREFPDEIKRELGKAIFDLQKGIKLTMPLSKTMSSISVGVEELRVRDRSSTYRLFYLARLKNEVLVFHAFQKKTQKTPQSEILLGQKRLKEMLDEKN